VPARVTESIGSQGPQDYGEVGARRLRAGIMVWRRFVGIRRFVTISAIYDSLFPDRQNLDGTLESGIRKYGTIYQHGTLMWGY
jgi:hypothetical protein